MYQLTVDAGTAVTVTDHADRDAAHGALMRYIVDKDFYLRPIQTSPARSTYELLEVQDLDECDRLLNRRPRSAGHALIEVLPREPAVPADTPYNAAAAARRWIDEHRQLWDHGSRTDAGARYPLAVLTAAKAEALCWFFAGTLLCEAAHLADVEPIGWPDPGLLHTLWHNATTRATANTQPSPAELAAAVQEVLPADAPATQTAALIWWCALLTWGANAT